MLFIKSKTIPVSDCYDFPKGIKAKIRPLGSGITLVQVGACCDLSPPHLFILTRQQHKGKSQRNGIACLTFKIESDRYNEVKGKHEHTADFRELFMESFMQLKIGMCIRMVFVFLSFVFTFGQRWHLQEYNCA